MECHLLCFWYGDLQMVDTKKLIKDIGEIVLIILVILLWSYFVFYWTFDYAFDSGVNSAKEIYKLC